MPDARIQRAERLVIQRLHHRTNVCECDVTYPAGTLLPWSFNAYVGHRGAGHHCAAEELIAPLGAEVRRAVRRYSPRLAALEGMGRMLDAIYPKEEPDADCRSH